MATNDDLDDFFKKKDRKGNKHKKQTGILTNNEELLKQLVTVTSATLAFKENMDFDDEEDEQRINDEPAIGTGFTDDTHKHSIQQHKTKNPDSNKHLNEQQINISKDGQQQQQQQQPQQQQQQQQQEEWEEFEDSNAKYEQLRLKFALGTNDNNDEYYDDENNPNNNDDNNDITGDREQSKDKPVWKIDQVKQQNETITTTNIEEPSAPVQQPPPPSKPSTTSSGAYRPPALRSGSSVTVVSGINQRAPKKKEPNLASTDEFPTLGAAVNKK